MVTKVEKIFDMVHGENPKYCYNGKSATKFLFFEKKAQRPFFRGHFSSIEVGPNLGGWNSLNSKSEIPKLAFLQAW